MEPEHDNIAQRVAAIIDPSLLWRVTWPNK
jgi:hypothetical protein